MHGYHPAQMIRGDDSVENLMETALAIIVKVLLKYIESFFLVYTNCDILQITGEWNIIIIVLIAA